MALSQLQNPQKPKPYTMPGTATPGGGGSPAGGGTTIGGFPSYNAPSPNFRQTPIGSVGSAGDLWDPRTETFGRTGAQIGTNAGQALKALQEASGLNLLGSYSSSGTGGAGRGAVGGVTLPTVQPPDMSAARSAAFARAKEQAGQTARSAIEALRGTMAERGLLGSGIEGGQTAEIIRGAAQGPNEITREQAIQDAANAAEWGAMQYQGGITQRGQDIQQRGQDIQAQEAERARQAQAIQGLLQFLPPGLMY